MQAVMEPIFEIPYLAGAVILGILTICRARGNKQFILFGVMAVVLGCGDAFHLVPRIRALFSAGTTALPQFAPSLGFGKMVTSITMTFFYVMLYHIWQIRYQLKNTLLTVSIYVLAVCRIILCLLPQNEWLSMEAPLSWGIYRNIPFVIMGTVIILLYNRQTAMKRDNAFRFMWLAITLSFLFYIPVVLFADAIPMIGMLMIPKTCAYVWIILMGFRNAADYISPCNIDGKKTIL